MELVDEVLKALLIAMVSPIFAPILKIIDSGRKKAETKRKLETLQLLQELDEKFM